jgi:Flp pilus assembly protein TadG
MGLVCVVLLVLVGFMVELGNWNGDGITCFARL